MDEADDIPLSKNTKILFNLIEIRLFDLSQVLQVGGNFILIQDINSLSTKLNKLSKNSITFLGKSKKSLISSK